MGTDLVVLDEDGKELDCHRIWKSWRDGDILEHPASMEAANDESLTKTSYASEKNRRLWYDSKVSHLRYFWMGISDGESARNTANDLRKYFPGQSDLDEMANWLEKWSKVSGVRFEASY